MKRIICFLATSLLLLSCVKEKIDIPKTGDGQVSTLEATEITLNSAVLWGKLNAPELANNAEWGVFVSVDKNPTEENGYKFLASDIDDDDRFFVDADGLDFGTKYYYQAFISLNDICRVSEIKSFVTETHKEPVVNLGVRDLKGQSATLYGDANPVLLSAGAEVGFIVSTDKEPALGNGERKVAIERDSNSRFFVSLSGLSVGCEYYFRPYARIGNTIHYGKIESFTTAVFAETVYTLYAEASYRSARLMGKLNPKSMLAQIGTPGFIISTHPQLSNEQYGKIYYGTKGDDYTFYADVPLEINTKYYFAAFIETQYSNFKEKSFSKIVKEFNTVAPETKAVDLGLSVNWLSQNVWAKYPEDFGGFYSWGEKTTSTYWYYLWFDKPEPGKILKYNTQFEYGPVDNKTVLDAEDDKVRQGNKKWRMPTKEEWLELNQKCSWEWTSLNGVNGMLVKGRNGNSIFLPAGGFKQKDEHAQENDTGYYWTSTLDEAKPTDAWTGIVGNGYGDASILGRLRSRGHLLRGVEDK